MWAILSYLDDLRLEDRRCKLLDLVYRLRSNYPATKPDIHLGLKEGWIDFDEGTRTYAITKEGREELERLRRHNETYLPRYVAEFKKRLGRH